MSCSSISPSPLGPPSSRRRVTTPNSSFSPHQHTGNSTCVNVAPLPQQCPGSRPNSTGGATASRASPAASTGPVNTCSTSYKCACATASVDSKCPYMRRVAAARIAASNKSVSGETGNQCTALIPATALSPTRVPASASANQSAASSAPRSSSSDNSSSSSSLPLVRGDEYSLYRLSKSAALQAASRGIQLTLVAPNSKFPSTPSSHSLHDHDNDTTTNTTATSSPHTAAAAAAAATGAGGASTRSASITTTITTRVRVIDSETGQSNGLIVSTTKRAVIRSAL